MAMAVRGVVAVGMIVRFVVGIRFVVQVGNVVLMQVRMVVRMLMIHGERSLYHKLLIMYHISHGNST